MPLFVSNTIQAHIAIYNHFLGDYEFILLKRADNNPVYPGIWQTVTGRIEEGETALEAAIREVFEETGLKFPDGWVIPYVTYYFDVARDEIHASPVFGFLSDKRPLIKFSAEHQRYSITSFTEASDLLALPTHIEGMRIFRDFILNGNKELFRFVNGK
jgi:8-oxo-dGTP pyrophosphatase MutT (NUDIX family)